MKSFWIVLGLAAVLGITFVTIACGPQKKFCPQIPNGVCPEPQDDAREESIFIDDSGAIIFEVGGGNNGG
jgi:hypothetical protein